MSGYPGDDFAEACYALERKRERLNAVVERCVQDFACEAIDENLDAPDGFEFSFIKRLDPYDRSIEFWAVPGAELSEFEQDCLWTLGFQRCWVCYIGVPHDAPIEQRERCYYKAKAAE